MDPVEDDWEAPAPVEQPLIDALPRWPHQLYAVAAVKDAIARGVRRILVTTPTGGGKSLEMLDLAMWMIREEARGVVLFCNRRILLDQFCRTLRSYELGHGVRAASHDTNQFEPLQIASVQTEHSRVVRRGLWDVHNCGLFLVDEAHMQENRQGHEVFERYVEAGAVKVGFTATPLSLDAYYDELVVAGTMSSLRDCGALVRAVQHGCSEPDLKNIRRIQVGEDLTDPANAKAIMVPGIHGLVLRHYRRLNPHGLPTLGFAPGVGESVGIAEAFTRAGVPSAHIDGDRIWFDGEEFPSTEATREKLFEMSRTGAVRVIWNRFVLREAVDMPWLGHGILASVIGSLASYIQLCGRLVRACPATGKREVTIQDHGGNWHRHGSINDDRAWKLGDTSKLLASLRKDRLTGDDGEPREPEPFVCPNCQTVLALKGLMVGTEVRCYRCGTVFDFRRRSRPVIQADGELVEHFGNIYKPRRVEVRPTTHAQWKTMYFRARNGGMTFSQAAGLFFTENGYWPPRDLPYMPQTTAEWYMNVSAVPFSRLRQEAHEANEADEAPGEE